MSLTTIYDAYLISDINLYLWTTFNSKVDKKVYRSRPISIIMGSIVMLIKVCSITACYEYLTCVYPALNIGMID